MWRGFTIHFKNNKVARVTGAGSARDKAEVALFGQAFADQAVAQGEISKPATPAPIVDAPAAKPSSPRYKVKQYCGEPRAWCLTLACGHVVNSTNVKVPHNAQCHAPECAERS